MYTLKAEKLGDRPTRKVFEGAPNPLPESCDLRSQVPVIFDVRTQTDSSVYHVQSVTALLQLMHIVLRRVILSQLFLNYLQRARCAGDSLVGAIAILTDTGCCLESSWPFEVTQTAVRPSDRCYDEAALYRIRRAEHVEPREDVLKACLAAGESVVVGLKLFESFHTCSGTVAPPSSDESTIGNGAFVLCGYDGVKRQFLGLWSQGAQFGDRGCVWFPYEYVLSDEYRVTDIWHVEVQADVSPVHTAIQIQQEDAARMAASLTTISLSAKAEQEEKKATPSRKQRHERTKSQSLSPTRAGANKRVHKKQKKKQLGQEVDEPEDVACGSALCSCIASTIALIRGILYWLIYCLYWFTCCCGYGGACLELMYKRATTPRKPKRRNVEETGEIIEQPLSPPAVDPATVAVSV